MIRSSSHAKRPNWLPPARKGYHGARLGWCLKVGSGGEALTLGTLPQMSQSSLRSRRCDD